MLSLRAPYPPRRIVCLSAETVETLYCLGQQDRIVGITGYATRPAEARRDKPRISGFIAADIGKILALEPDLVLAFSDLQADIVATLMREGVAVHAFNQRDIAGILAMIRTLGALVGVPEPAARLVKSLTVRLDAARKRAAAFAHHPKVYFEEWDTPPITGIRWVSELIEIAGGTDVFADRARKGAARDRIVTAAEVIERAPELIIGSWCGKKFKPSEVKARPGFAAIPAIARGAVHEIPSSLLLAPGPGALTDGLAALQLLIERIRKRR
jgi:iron complex transport system substrate-binding protein